VTIFTIPADHQQITNIIASHAKEEEKKRTKGFKQSSLFRSSYFSYILFFLNEYPVSNQQL
jgi:hypothetical protein